MTIDFWGLGLQAVNVLILVWLLSRVFWRPIAGAIAKRQATVQTLLDNARTAQDEADAALAEVTATRAGIAAEREKVLAEAARKAEAAAQAALVAAREKAGKLVAAAELASDRKADAARAAAASDSARLAVDIARKLLARLETDAIQAAFVDQLVTAVEQMPETDRAALAGVTPGIEVVSASDLGHADRARITQAVQGAVGDETRLTFVTDSDLIAGMEIRTGHFVLHNSWQSDLERILKDLADAAG